MSLSIHLFGHLRLFQEGQPLKFNTLPKSRQLLAYLLLHSETAVSREHLAYLLWNDVSESEARTNLRRHLHDLRRALPTGHDWIVSNAQTLQWNPHLPFWLDVVQFSKLAEDPQRLVEAIMLYTGDLLPDLYDDWLIPHREQLHTCYLHTINQLIQREKQRGDLSQAMLYARQLLNLDPLREDVLRDLMQMRHTSGDRAGAMQLYHQFYERLQEELGVEPMPDTTAVYQSILTNSQNSPTYPEPPPTPRHNLPASPTSFIGRHHELTHVTHLLSHPQTAVRLLTITGPGGSGKTRLALEAATHLAAQKPTPFLDGIYFIRLDNLTNPDQLIPATMQALNLPITSQQNPADALQHHLSQHHLLLILDNFEHLLPAACLISQWLAAAPHLTILVTSQVCLHLYGEHELSLDPLPLPDRQQPLTLETILDSPAIALFVARAQAVRPDFALTDDNKTAVADICTNLDGMPLAIELAAARSKYFSPAAMCVQLQQRFQFLTTHTRDLSARQQTLRATIDWSYHLLSPEEQAVFQALAIFVGVFPWSAAETVSATAVPPTTTFYDIISALIDRNIVRQTPTDTLPTFRLLSTLREYGLEKLEQSSIASHIHQQHALTYLEIARHAQTLPESKMLNELENAHDNLRAALTWAVHSQNPQLGLQICATLTSFWENRGHIAEGRRWLDQFLTLATDLPTELHAEALFAIGYLAYRHADFVPAQAHFAHSLHLWQTLPQPTRQLARAQHYMGLILRRTPQPEAALPYYKQSLATYWAIGDPNGAAAVLNSLGSVAYNDGDLAQARTIFAECLVLERSIGNPHSLSRALNNLGVVAYALADFAASQACHTEALALRRLVGNKPGIAQSLNNLGRVLLRQQDNSAATQLLAEGAELYLELGMKIGVMETIECLAMLAAYENRPQLTAQLGATAVRLHKEVGAPMDPLYEPEMAAAMALAQAQLPSPMWQLAWQEGALWDMATAVAQAITHR
jgi:predicted ATPase/DNA-binding SARP family transcriptional activator